MDTSLPDPVFSDVADLEKTLSDDRSGDSARAMLGYFEEMARATETMLRDAASDAERRFAADLAEGFRASQQIVRHVWQVLHSAALPV